jgi:hypothetical protein
VRCFSNLKVLATHTNLGIFDQNKIRTKLDDIYILKNNSWNNLFKTNVKSQQVQQPHPLNVGVKRFYKF